jgi:hypothetical protein
MREPAASLPRPTRGRAAQQAFAAEHLWFEVRRLQARGHFAMVEVMDVLAATIEAFA